jgi:hypothetical protein
MPNFRSRRFEVFAGIMGGLVLSGIVWAVFELINSVDIP